MNLKEKLILLKEKVIQWIKTYKKIVIPCSIGVMIFLLFIFNMNLLQVTYFKMKQMPDKVINILSKTEPKDYNDFYFQQGLEYLIEDGSEISLSFLEKHFVEFDMVTKNKIIEMYNEKQLVFAQQDGIFDMVINEQVSDSIKAYIKRLEDTNFERALDKYFQDTTKLTQDTVDALYRLLAIRGDKIPLEHFKLSIFELLNFPHHGDEESNSIKILDFIEPDSVKSILMDELKINEIDIETLSIWIDILNKKRIITPQEYVGFTNGYGMIKKAQESLKQIQIQEIELMNMKQAVDIETDILLEEVSRLNKEIQTLKEQQKTYNDQVADLKNYKQVDLYILDRYENGEYEAAIPEKSFLFNTYKPSSKKVRLKVTRTTIVDMGVQSFQVYEGGKLEDGAIYYTEVSQEQIDKIKEAQSKVDENEASVKLKQSEIDKLNQEIAQIRKANNYESTLNLIEELDIKKGSIELEIEKNKLAIQNLFGIGKIVV